jgi:electron transfer flavoprotein alpha/beta subunit
MTLLVPVKRVLDYTVKVRVKADQSGVDLANLKMPELIKALGAREASPCPCHGTRFGADHD